MECTGSRTNRRIVMVNGESYLMPRNISTKIVSLLEYTRVRWRIPARSCEVNGIKVEKGFEVGHAKLGFTMENVLAMRALKEVLMPMSGPSQSNLHKILASFIMEAFDREHPDRGILDTDTVSVLYRRYIYVRKSRYLAGELRQLKRHSEIDVLLASLLQDETVMSSKLDPAPTAPHETKPESAATARSLVDAGVVQKKRQPLRSKGPRSVVFDDGTSWLLPWGVHHREHRSGSSYLVVEVQLKRGSCKVNGRTVSRTVTSRHRCATSDIAKPFVLALRAVRDELFPADEPARNQVHKVVAARVLGVFERSNPESDIHDETVVVVQVARHGYVKESSFVAGDLRVVNENELAIMTERFLNDPAVVSGELEPAPASASTGSTPRDPGRSGDIGEEPTRSDDEARRVVRTDDVDSLQLPLGIYPDADDAGGGKTMRLKVKPPGVVWVNGEEVKPEKKMKVVGGIAVNAGNIAALRSLRDDFALGLGASPPVRMVVAAKAFRLWLRGRPGVALPDSTAVRITDGACEATGVGHYVVSTAGDLRRVDAGKARVVRELLSALVGASSGGESESVRQPAVCAVGEGAPAEVRDGSALLIEGPTMESGSRDSSTKRGSKRKRRAAEEEDGGWDGGTWDGAHEGKKTKKKKRKARRGRDLDRSEGQESPEVASAARKAEIVLVDLTSDSPTEETKETGKERKRQREGQANGSSDRDVRNVTIIEEDSREREGARGSCKSSVETRAREERGLNASFETSAERGASATAPAPPAAAEQKAQVAVRQNGWCQKTLEEGNKKRKSKKSKTKKDSRSGQSIPLDGPMERAKKKKKRGKAGKGRHSGSSKSDSGNRVGQGSGVIAKSQLLAQGYETETARRKPLLTSAKMRLMDWITNG